MKAQDLNGHQSLYMCLASNLVNVTFSQYHSMLQLKSLFSAKGLTEKVRTPSSNLCTYLMITPGGVTSQSLVLDVVSKSFGDQLRCLGGEWLLSEKCPPAGNMKTNFKHCLGIELRLLEMTFHQDLSGR